MRSYTASVASRPSQLSDLCATASGSTLAPILRLLSVPKPSLILRRHERDQDPLGTGAPRQRRRSCLRLGCDGMDRMEARLDHSPMIAVVRNRLPAGASEIRTLGPPPCPFRVCSTSRSPGETDAFRERDRRFGSPSLRQGVTLSSHFLRLHAEAFTGKAYPSGVSLSALAGAVHGRTGCSCLRHHGGSRST